MNSAAYTQDLLTEALYGGAFMTFKMKCKFKLLVFSNTLSQKKQQNWHNKATLLGNWIACVLICLQIISVHKLNLCINNKVIYPFHQIETSVLLSWRHYKNRNIGYRKKTRDSGVIMIRNHPEILFFQFIDLFGLYEVEEKLKAK